MELPEIKKALADRAEDVCKLLLPDGMMVKGEWVGGRLASGVGGHSLSVSCHGDKAGIFKDFGGTDGGSNMLELWVQARGVPFQDALREAKEWLVAHGVNMDGGAKFQKKEREPRAYSKPDKRGVTWIANAAEFYLTVDRKIPREIVEAYKIAMTEDGTAIVFPYLHENAPHAAQMLKFLALERTEDGKKKTWTSKDTPKVLFGKHTVKPADRYLLICEGEPDALTWASMKIPGLCVCSVPFGAKWEGKDGKDPNDEWIGEDWEFISRFERVYLSMDMDEPGKQACASIVKRLGREICFVIALPLKDANELLKACREAELTIAFNAAKTLDPAALRNAGEYRDAVLARMFSADANTKRGIPLPFGNYPFHLRWHEWTVITGMNGSGKTVCLSFITNYLAKLGYSSCVASLEVHPEQTIEFFIRQQTGEKSPDRPKAEAAMDAIEKGIWFYERVGRANWKDVLTTFRYAYRRHGCRFFIIDSWMKMGISSDDLDAQAEVIGGFSEFVDGSDVHLFVVAHPRKLKNEEEQANKLDVKGSGQLTDEAHNVITVWRNKKKEKEIEMMEKMKTDPALITQKKRAKPDALMIVGKQRNDDGAEPTIDLWYVSGGKQFFGHYTDTGFSFLDAKTDAPSAPPAPAEEIDEDQPF
jgi:twinkle protein